ncbi:106_t:CDS:2, partial [Gigaspora margarita]
YNEAKRFFMGLTDLDYKPGHREYTFYKYWLGSNGHTDKNNTALLDTYRPEEIYSQYIIWMSLRLIIDIDARQKPDPTNSKVLSLDVACADALSLIPECTPFLNSFALA